MIRRPERYACCRTCKPETKGRCPARQCISVSVGQAQRDLLADCLRALRKEDRGLAWDLMVGLGLYERVNAE